MVNETLIFVSKRLQRPVAALLCLMAAQLLLGVAGGQPVQPAASSVRVAIGR